MDVASTIFTLAKGILTFIAAHEDKTTTTIEIQDFVQLIQRHLEDLFSQPNDLKVDKALKSHLLLIQRTLRKTHKHLRYWNKSRTYRVIAWFGPSIVTQQLKDDRQLLWEYYLMLITTVALKLDRDLVHGYNVISYHPRSLPSTPLTPATPPRRANSEVTDFWHRCIGSRSTPANTKNFCNNLSAYLELDFSPVACKRLLLKLDGGKTGHISFSTFRAFMKVGRLAEVVKLYVEDPRLPLLLWIDDNLTGNTHEVLEAIKRGVTVIQLTSTSTAKAWIVVNKEFLKRHDSPANVRYISDQVRTEPGAHGATFTNYHAGSQIMEFIRDQGLKAPILIYTDRKGIEHTHYAERDKMAGSSVSRKVCLEYIAALATRKKYDKGWMKFNARPRFGKGGHWDIMGKRGTHKPPRSV
jgi:hypothetical protein